MPSESVDISGIRFLDRNIAAVNFETLIYRIQLIPKADSPDRLLDVTEHPSAKRYFIFLFYKAYLLKSPHHLRLTGRNVKRASFGRNELAYLRKFLIGISHQLVVFCRADILEDLLASVAEREHPLTKQEVWANC